MLTSESQVWKRGSDPRVYLMMERALLLQVSHPKVSRGVERHSDFLSDPWRRLVRTISYVNGSIYGKDVPGLMRKIREGHKRIEGALDPEVFAWVHLSLGETIIVGHKLAGARMSFADANDFYRDWKRLGNLLGIQNEDMPRGYYDLTRYVERAAWDLAPTPTALAVVEMFSHPPAPLSIPGLLWAPTIALPARLIRLATKATLPLPLADVLKLRLGDVERKELALATAVLRRMPASRVGPAWMKLSG